MFNDLDMRGLWNRRGTLTTQAKVERDENTKSRIGEEILNIEMEIAYRQRELQIRSEA